MSCVLRQAFFRAKRLKNATRTCGHARPCLLQGIVNQSCNEKETTQTPEDVLVPISTELVPGIEAAPVLFLPVCHRPKADRWVPLWARC